MVEITVEHNLDDWFQVLASMPVEIRREAMPQVSKRIGREILRRFRRTVQTWRRKPRFEVLEEATSTSITVLAGTDSEIYRYVDQGTRPHIIEPRGAGYPLRFQSMYQAKTMPGMLSSRQGGPSGPYVSAYRVRHPGTQARRFSETILKEVRPMGYQMLIKTARRIISKRLKWASSRGPR